jgi:hypothetical protein
MSRERWGTFSVRDHLGPKAFVADVLLYDRLVIPFPPNDEERERWRTAGWQPDVLESKLEILRDVGIRVAWDENKQRDFKTQYKTALATGSDAEMHRQELRDQLPYEITKQLLEKKYLPDLPYGVSKVWAMAAFSSYNRYQEDQQKQDGDKEKDVREEKRKLAMVLTHRFLVPDDAGKPDDQLLREAIELARRDDFKEKRTNFYKWQENIIEEGITDKKAIEEMEVYLEQYNQVVKAASKEVKVKFGFLVIKLGLSIPGILLGQAEPIATGLMDIYSYFKSDKKLNIEAGECGAAAMIHDAQKHLKWG